jgi:hypothetical protein
MSERKQNLKRSMDKLGFDFYNKPHGFSFKDLIAWTIYIMFAFFSFKALDNERAISIIQVWMPLILTVSGLYFAQEGFTMWNYSNSNSKSQNNNMLYPAGGMNNPTYGQPITGSYQSQSQGFGMQAAVSQPTIQVKQPQPVSQIKKEGGS